MNSPSTVLTELRSVSHSFGGAVGDSVEILHDVQLEVSDGDVIALLGPSGCGKSTIMRALAGLLVPTGGQVLYRGQPLTGVNPGVAMVFQNFALFPWLTVRQNIMLGLVNTGLEAEEQEKRLAHVLTLVGLEGYERTYPKELSGGMKQRVGFARALIVRPEILCLDEPFSALDVLTAQTLRTEIGRLCAEPQSHLKSLVIVTHNIDEAVYLARRIVVLAAHPGRIQVIVNNPLPYPRDEEDPQFRHLVTQIHGILTQTILPDQLTLTPTVPVVSPQTGARRIVMIPLPNVSIGEVLGLLRFLGEEEENLFELATRVGKEFGAILTVVKAAELLSFVDTPGQNVKLTALGSRMMSGSVADQKKILHEEVGKLKIFDLLTRMIQASEDHQVTEDTLHAELQTLFPNEKPKALLRTLIGWGRAAELISHDARKKVVRPFEKTYFGKPKSERVG